MKKAHGPTLNISNESKKDLSQDLKISVVFKFFKVKYCENCKKKDYVNANRVTNMTGSAYLILTSKGTDVIFKVSDKEVEWTQKRTENMNPPKPISQEIKEIWKRPNGEGFGLIGLGVKKLGGGLKNTLLGPIGSGKISDEDLECTFDDAYSSQNLLGVTPEVKKPKNKNNSKEPNGKIEEFLISKMPEDTDLDWDLDIEDGIYIFTVRYRSNNLVKISFKLK